MNWECNAGILTVVSTILPRRSSPLSNARKWYGAAVAFLCLSSASHAQLTQGFQKIVDVTEPVEVHAVARGPVAIKLLGSALVALAQEHPEIVFRKGRYSGEIGSLEGRCGAQADGSKLRGCVFWDAMVAIKAWPTGAPQLETVANALRRPGPLPIYRLPDVEAVVDESLITASLPIEIGPSGEVPKLAQRELCRRQRWSNDDADLDCVVEMIPSFGEVSNEREFILRQRIVRLSIKDVPAAKAAAVRATLQKAFALAVPADRASRGVVEEELIAKPLFQGEAVPAATCADEELKRDATRAHQAIDWPPEIPRSAAPADSLTIVDPIEGAIGEQPYAISSKDVVASKFPDNVVRLARHPMFTDTPPWSVACSSMQPDIPLSQLSHSLAIASLLVGQESSIKLSGGSDVKVVPFFRPASVRIAATKALYPDSNTVGPPGRPQVIVASYQHDAPKPPVQQGNAPPVGARKVLYYRKSTSSLMYGGNIVVAAAATIPDTATMIEQGPELSDNVPCTNWPACLDSTGWTLTVAALDYTGKLLEKEPRTHLRYELSDRIVSVAASGDRLPVVTVTNDGPTLATATGTSLAAPAVAALALKMRETLSQPAQAYNVITGIQASADLTRNFDGRIRFGVVNARRALAAIAVSPGGVLQYKMSNDETRDAAGQAASFVARGIEPPDSCTVAQADIKAGVLLYYREDDPPVDVVGNSAPNCVPVKYLLRVRNTGSVNGVPRFTIVYNRPKATMQGRIFAHVERNVALQPFGAATPSCMIALGSPAAQGTGRPCLVAPGPAGSVVSVDLLGYDLLFNPSNYEVM